MGKLDLITALASVEEALKRAPRADTCRKLAGRLAGVRSSLLMVGLPATTDAQAAMAALVEAAHAAGVNNRELAEAFNAAVERFPR